MDSYPWAAPCPQHPCFLDSISSHCFPHLPEPREQVLGQSVLCRPARASQEYVNGQGPGGARVTQGFSVPAVLLVPRSPSQGEFWGGVLGLSLHFPPGVGGRGRCNGRVHWSTLGALQIAKGNSVSQQERNIGPCSACPSEDSLSPSHG